MWCIDETYIKIKEKWCYLYRVSDTDNHTLNIWLRRKRDNYSAYTFIKRFINQFDKNQMIITDQALSAKVTMSKLINDFKLKSTCHCTSKYLNNLIEQDYRHIKIRNTRYPSIDTVKNTLKGIECIHSLYKKNRRSLQRSTDSRRATKLISHMLVSYGNANMLN